MTVNTKVEDRRSQGRWFNDHDFAVMIKENPDQERSRPALAAWSDAGGGQATQGTGWMPWRQEPMKDVAGCVKPRGVASRRRSEDVLMGKPGWGHAQSPLAEPNRPGGGKPAN